MSKLQIGPAYFGSRFWTYQFHSTIHLIVYFIRLLSYFRENKIIQFQMSQRIYEISSDFHYPHLSRPSGHQTNKRQIRQMHILCYDFKRQRLLTLPCALNLRPFKRGLKWLLRLRRDSSKVSTLTGVPIQDGGMASHSILCKSAKRQSTELHHELTSHTTTVFLAHLTLAWKSAPKAI